LRRQLAALFAFCIIDTLGFGILIPLVPYMADRFGVAPQWITPVLGSYSLCQLLAAPHWGRLSDRYGRRPILMSSLGGAFLSYVILAFAHNIWWLLASRMLAGLMAGNIAAAFAYASDVSPPEKRAGVLGMIGAAIGIGFTLGQPVGGLLAGKDAASANFVPPAVVSACTSLLAILLVRFVLPESHAASARAASESRRGSWQLLRERPALGLLASATLLVTYAQAVLESIFAIWALHRYGFGPRTVGFLLLAAAVPALVMQGGVVRVLAPRLGEARLACGVLALRTGLLTLKPGRHLRRHDRRAGAVGWDWGTTAPSRWPRGSSRATAACMGAYVASASRPGDRPVHLRDLFLAGKRCALLVALVTLPAAWLVRRAGQPRLS
jgi:MFS family permease